MQSVNCIPPWLPRGPLFGSIILTCVALFGSYLNKRPERGSSDFTIDPYFDLPRPPIDLQYSATNNIICMVLMTATGLLAVLLGARDARRSKTLLPLALPLSGAMIAFPETFIDVMGCIYYPQSENNASFHLLGHEMPPWIPIWFGYGALMQMNLELLRTKTPTRNLQWFLGLMMVSDLVIEEILLPMGVYHYYGNQPLIVLNMFPWWWMAPNSVGVFFATVIAHRFQTILTGWKVLSVFLLTPMCVGGVYGFIAFPAWVAVNGDFGWLVTQFLGLLTIAFGFVAFSIILQLVLERDPFQMEGGVMEQGESTESPSEDLFSD